LIQNLEGIIGERVEEDQCGKKITL